MRKAAHPLDGGVNQINAAGGVSGFTTMVMVFVR
jgi:hypothetical protein